MMKSRQLECTACQKLLQPPVVLLLGMCKMSKTSLPARLL
jgi:hypothetical protein